MIFGSRELLQEFVSTRLLVAKEKQLFPDKHCLVELTVQALFRLPLTGISIPQDPEIPANILPTGRS